jgi:hypothetical protein
VLNRFEPGDVGNSYVGVRSSLLPPNMYGSRLIGRT